MTKGLHKDSLRKGEPNKTIVEDNIEIIQKQPVCEKEVVNDLLEGEPIKSVRLPDGRYVTEELAKQLGVSALI